MTRIALSLLCENPTKHTGLTTVFREVINRSLRDRPDLEWVVFRGKGHDLGVGNSRVRQVDWFPANNRLGPRLVSDHFLVGPTARLFGCRAIVTVGFVPVVCPMPCAMHILTLHHLSPDNQISNFRNRYRAFAIDRGLKKARLVITNSEFAAGQIRATSRHPLSKMIISNEGLDHEIFQPTPSPGEVFAIEREFRLQPGYLLWLSNLYPYKQAECLIEAYAGLPLELRKAHPLVFVGGDWEGQLAARKAQAHQLHVADDVRFLGWVDEKFLVPLYRQAGAHVLASREETWGRTVSEAMACGCPCVVNDIPVMREVARDAAIVVDFRDRKAATAALCKILSDAETQDRLRKAGIARAAELSFDRLVKERMDAIYSFCLKKSPQ